MEVDKSQQQQQQYIHSRFNDKSVNLNFSQSLSPSSFRRHHICTIVRKHMFFSSEDSGAYASKHDCGLGS